MLLLWWRLLSTRNPCAERLGAVTQNAENLPSGVTEWVFRDQFTFPVLSDPKHIYLRRVVHFGGIGNGTSARRPRKESSHDRSGRGGNRYPGSPRNLLRFDLIPIPRR